GVLGQALRVLGGGPAGALLAGPGGRNPHGGRALLLPARGQAHVHRRTREDGAGDRALSAELLDLPLRGGRGRLRRVPEAPRHGRPPRRVESVLAWAPGCSVHST